MNLITYPEKLKEQLFFPFNELQNDTSLPISEFFNKQIVLQHSQDTNLIKTEIDNNIIKIHYSEINDIFRAIGRTISLDDLNINQIISERRKLKKIFIMLDVSRNAVLKPDTVKKIIRFSALSGINGLMLYTEDTFEIENEPYFGYMRGRYSKKEISELDKYAASFGIEMVPCIQTLAHLQRILKYQTYASVKDTSSVLLCETPQTYQFIEKMLKNAVEPYAGKRIHIGMDEAMDLGRGAYLDKFGYKPAAKLMKSHLDKVMEIIRKLNLEPMMWSDMFFRAASPERKYFDKSINITPEIAETVPDNIKLVYWDYFHTDTADYDRMIKQHFKLSDIPPVIAPGLHTWNRFYPAYSYAMPRIKSALQTALKYNLTETILTIWGDDGTECDFTSAMPLVKYAADIIFSDENPLPLTEKSIEKFTGFPFSSWQTGEEIDNLPGNTTFDNISKMLLWEDPLTGLCRKQKKYPLNNHYAELKKKIENINNCKLLTIPWCICDILEIKADLPDILSDAYKKNDLKTLNLLKNKIIPELILKISYLEYEHRSVWFRNNKPFGWDVLQRRYGGLKAVLENLIIRLDDFTSGRVSSIEELEQEHLLILPPREDGFPLTACYNHFFTTSYHGH